ncbi:hypothetical protein [Streptomyces sp. NPDC048269]|uniref:nSTAND1 domain-containing NTPase n=1 Tax=Streptomyces sp. NPDC048269 TaxID=3155753 RepID=UPI0034200D86
MWCIWPSPRKGCGDRAEGWVTGQLRRAAEEEDVASVTPTQVLREILPELAERGVCPYRGLGRLTLLLGPSGSGKSSLIQAGVLRAPAEGESSNGRTPQRSRHLEPAGPGDIITLPARDVGLHFQPGLPERIVTDVLATNPEEASTRQAPVTVLPLLELTLSQLWLRRQDGYLTHEAGRRTRTGERCPSHHRACWAAFVAARNGLVDSVQVCPPSHAPPTDALSVLLGSVGVS